MLATRSGSVTSMRCVADGKYSSIGLRLTVIFPWPGRTRTLATAALRRPVVWLSGAGSLVFGDTVRWVLSAMRRAECGGSAAGVGPGLEGQGLGLLGLVRVLGAGVDLELRQLGPAEPGARQHA